MNIIDINYKILKEEIGNYVTLNSELTLNPYGCAIYNNPILLMSDDTLQFFKEKNKYLIRKADFEEKDCFTIWGCHIAIGNWLPFGEVKLVKEV